MGEGACEAVPTMSTCMASFLEEEVASWSFACRKRARSSAASASAPDAAGDAESSVSSVARFWSAWMVACATASSSLEIKRKTPFSAFV
jgi:hypothetical protein